MSRQLDTIDRQQLHPRVKIELLLEEAHQFYGRDPRAGGMSIVGRPAAILQMLLDLKVGPGHEQLRLERPVVIGAIGADVVGWWLGVPVVVRSVTIDNNVYCTLDSRIPESRQIDRRQAGVLRVHAHRGTLESVREVEK